MEACSYGGLYFQQSLLLETHLYVSHHCEVAFHSDKYEWDTMIDLGLRIVLPKGPHNSSKYRKFRL